MRLKRSISLDEDTLKAINTYRGEYMLEKGVDYPFTKALNDLLRKALKIN